MSQTAGVPVPMCESGRECRRVRTELEFMKTCGVIELMIRNPNIDSFVREKENELDTLKKRVRALIVSMEHEHVTTPGECRCVYCQLYRDCQETNL